MANQLTPNNPLIQEIGAGEKTQEPVWHNRSILNFCPLTGRLGVRLWNTSNKASTGPNMENRALKECIQRTDERVWQRLFSLQYSVHAALLSDLLNSTDSVC